MASLHTELSLEAVRDYMVYKGGRVTNHELVKQFKSCLTAADSKELARNKFKQYVNTLANISQEGGEKYLVLKRRYRIGTPLEVDEYPNSPPGCATYFQSPYGSPTTLACSSTMSPTIPPPYRAPPPYRPPQEPGMPSPSLATDYSGFASPFHYGLQFPSPHNMMEASIVPQSCPYGRGSFQDPQDLGIPPAPPAMPRSSSSNSLLSSISSVSSLSSYSQHSIIPTPMNFNQAIVEPSNNQFIKNHFENYPSEQELDSGGQTQAASLTENPPAVPPRRRSDKESRRQSHNQNDEDVLGYGPNIRRNSITSIEDERKVSVREATQKFNRMASELQLSSRNSGKSSRASRLEREEDDQSLNSFGPEAQEWLVASAKSDFNEILRLLKIQPALAKSKTALHWASKHGKTEVIKLLLGTYHLDINARSNGGYTPLHLAAIYNRHEVFDLLTHYGGDLNIRDYSGKKPRQYQATTSSTLSSDAQMRIVRRRNSLKEASSGFLRIGSLNVKVRKTTEAFNSLISRDVEARLHRSWGSSDSLPDGEKVSKLMPPPKFVPLKKRKSKKDKENCQQKSTSQSTTPAVTPPSSRSQSSLSLPSIYNQDSDSDTACGFGGQWGAK